MSDIFWKILWRFKGTETSDFSPLENVTLFKRQKDFTTQGVLIIWNCYVYASCPTFQVSDSNCHS